MYAFFRCADDAVDEVPSSESAGDRVEQLYERLDRIYSSSSIASVIDRAFSRVVHYFDIPRSLPTELLAGMNMDAVGTSYRTESDLLQYCFRVASVVGLSMTIAMLETRRAPIELWLRAADLGIAMQLTNIARDVGEDARRARVYVPTDWLHELGSTREEFAAQRGPTEVSIAVTKRLLASAKLHYAAADVGIPMLPADCRTAIASSRRIYAAIGDAVEANGYDNIRRRASVSLSAKLRLIFQAWRATPASPPPNLESDDLIARWIRRCGLDATSEC